MHRKICILITVMAFVILSAGCAFGGVSLSAFPDPVFREYLRGYDIGWPVYASDGSSHIIGQNDGILGDPEIERIININLSYSSYSNIQSLEGIRYLTSLQYLGCSDLQLTSLNLSGCASLKDLKCYNNQLTSLNVTGCTAMTNLYCWNNQLTSLNVSGCTALEDLQCYNNQLTSINVNGCTHLEGLLCNDNQLTSLNVSGLSALKYLHCTGNQLTSLNITGCNALQLIDCFDNQITSLNASGFTDLQKLHAHNNQLTHLNVTGCTALQEFDCDRNKLTEIDLSTNTALQTAYCGVNPLTSLKMGKNTDLRLLHCAISKLTSLDVTGFTSLQELYCDNTQLTSLDVSKNTVLTTLYCNWSQLRELDLSNNTALQTIYCSPQTSKGLKVKATSSGYEVNLNDYVSKPENIDPFSLINKNQSAGFISYDGEKGTVLFANRPAELHYDYITHSPNNDVMDVTIKVSLNVDVIERGKGKDLIIGGMNDNCYLDTNGKTVTESSIADLSARIYGKKGFVADGNSRLIVRVKTQRPGNVTFEVKDNIGVHVERLSDRADFSLASYLTPNVSTTQTSEGNYQASIVLVAPEMYPSGKSFPSDKFAVHVKFTADETGEEIPEEEKEMEEDIELEIHAAPVVLIQGFGFGSFGSTEDTFDVKRNKGIWRTLKDNKLNVGYMSYDGKLAPSAILARQPNPMFNMITLMFHEHYYKKSIVCTKADIVAFGLGGLMARHFCTPDSAPDDGNYYTKRSYRQGMVRRIITIATPHRGTTWANWALGDFSALNSNVEPGVVETLRRAFWGVPWVARFWPIKNLDDACRDMAVGGRITSEPYPVNVPIHSIYGKAKEDWEFWLNILAELIDLTSIYRKYRLVQQLIPMLNGIDFVYSAKGAVTMTREQIRLIIEEHMRVLKKSVFAGEIHQLSKHSNAGQWVSGFLHLVEFVLSPWTSSVTLMDQMLQETLAFGEDNDFCVTESSAGGDFVGYSTPMKGLAYNHFLISHRQETADRIMSLIKGSKDEFRVFDKIGTPSAKNTTASYEDNSGQSDLYSLKFSMTVEPQTLSISETDTVRIIAKPHEEVSADYVCIVIESSKGNEIIPVDVNDSGTFEVNLGLSSRDVGVMNVYCFSRGDGEHIYISNTAQFIVSPKTDNLQVVTLGLAGKAEVIFTDSSSDIPAGLIAQTSDGFAFDVSSPLMGTSWTSSNPSAAYVSSDGMIHSLADGSATLTASYAGLTASIIVNVGNNFSVPEITSQSLDAGNVGKNYTAQLQASGTPLISWRIIDGRLPFDLTLSDSGMISGYPSEEGTFTFTAEASNIFGTDSKDFTITIGNAAGAAITIDANNFPDDSFRAFISDNLDWNHDGLLTEQEISSVTAIDVSNMGIKSLKGIEFFTALEYLTCNNNELTELDLSKNENIYGVASQNNKLESINLANCLKLFQIWLDNNKLSSLDLADCHALNILSCKNNLITTLDLRRQANITDLQCDEGVEILYSDTPGGSEILIDANNFPDDAFRKFIADNFDWDKSSSLSDSEIAAITGIEAVNMGIKTLKGIEHFTALEYLTCADNELEEIDLSGNPNFIGLAANNNKLKRVNVSNNPKLYQIWVNNNKLSALDFSHNPELAIIDCSKNLLTELDISENANLRELYFVNYPDEGSEDVDYHTLQGNAIRNIDLSGAPLLTHIACSANGIATLDLSNNPLLESIECHYNYLTQIDTSIFTELKYLHVAGNKLSTLDVSQNTNLQELFCGDNLLETLTLGDKPEMFRLHCWGNNLQSLNLTECPALKELHFSSNKISAADLTNCKELVSLDCGNNLLETLTLGDKPGLLKLYCYRNNLTALNLSGCPALKELSFGANKISAVDIANCKELESLAFWDNLVTELDISAHVKLKDCIFGNNRVKTLNVGNKPELLRLHCYSNDLSAIDITGCPAIQDFSCEGNKISVLDVTKCKVLKKLYCRDNLIKVLDLSECPKITALTVDEGVKLIYTHEETPPEILTETLTNAATNQPYSLQLTASGATPLTWTHSGKLPAGLSLSASGLISGTPTKAGKSSFTVTAENSYGKTSKPFTLEAFDPVSITTASLKAGTITKSYSVTMRAKGTKAITWSAEGLPDGLTINDRGKISGKPSEYGVFNVKLKAENGAGITEKTLRLEIKAIAPTLSGTLAKPTLNVPYSSGLKLSKGSTPVTWSVEGNLPGGLSLDPNTGIISGTPTSYDKSGFKITITATNYGGSKSKKITLKVKGTAPKITAKLPQATAGQYYSAELSATGSEPITFAAELPEFLTLEGSTISGTVPDSVRSFKIKAYASNPVKKNVKKSYTIRVSTKKSLPQNQNDDNGTDITGINKGINSGIAVGVPSFTENSVYSYSESLVIVAELGEVSADKEGLYDFDVELPDCIPEGLELVYISNSDEPSEDDDIAEFFDEEGNEITKVPESRKITVSIWLNPERIYMPVIAVKH